MQRYYEKHNLEDIAKAWDGSHQFNFITKKLAFEISNQIKNFRKPIQLNTYPEIDFKICYFDEYKKFIIQNSLMSEQYSRIKSGDKIKFEEMYYGYKILAIHTWNNTDNTDMNNMKKDWNMLTHTISPIVLQNKKIRISKPTNFMNMVVSIQNKIYIDKYTIIKYSNKDQFDEFYHNARTWESFNIAKHLDLISVFLIKGELVQDDLNNIYTNNSEISEYYNFSRLIPPVEWYKEIINEYCLVLDPRKKAPLYNQIATLNNEKQKLIDEKSNLQAQINQLESILNSLSIKKQQLEISNLEQDLINKKLQTKQLETQLNIASNKKIARDIQLVTIGKNSAKTRIQNQLSYKLGQAMIVNSKSLLGYIRMPFALSYIKDKHKQEQKIYQEKIKKDPSLKLPPLETYPDYQEALKEKECFTYKLGEALIKANKTWYKGGYLKFYFKDIPKLKRDFRQKR
ncbi:hypothetical protein B11476_02820 [Campylobacter coli]|nr:hypothetical protein B11476_02820 [Campylobacter coli]